jgi:hypothetical protein
MANIFETYKNAPKFEDVKFFKEEGKIKITGEWQYKIAFVCGKEGYEIYRKEFLEWLLIPKATIDLPIVVRSLGTAKIWLWKGIEKCVNDVRIEVSTETHSRFFKNQQYDHKIYVENDSEWVRKNWDNL